MRVVKYIEKKSVFIFFEKKYRLTNKKSFARKNQFFLGGSFVTTFTGLRLLGDTI